MALINCPECGKEISDKAEFCPNCGYPIESDYEDYEDYEEDKEIISAKHIYECTCHCLSCGNEFSYTNVDIAKNKSGRWVDIASTHNLISGSNIEKAIALNHKQESYQMDFNKCPNCGSRKLRKEYDNYYIDQDGEYIEDYEPSIFDKIGEYIGKFFSFLGDLLHKGCLILTIIPFLLLLWFIIQVISLFF